MLTRLGRRRSAPRDSALVVKAGWWPGRDQPLIRKFRRASGPSKSEVPVLLSRLLEASKPQIGSK